MLRIQRGTLKSQKKDPSKTVVITGFREVYRIPVSSLLHRPGKARRGFKVGFRFRLQDRFTTASRQSPHVERKSDQST